MNTKERVRTGDVFATGEVVEKRVVREDIARARCAPPVWPPH